MVDTQELIDKINAGDMADAGRAFTELMGSKVQDALDDRKVELGNQMHLTPEELKELEAAELNDEDFEEDEDLDLEDEEDAGEDDQEPEEEGEEVEDEDDEDVQPDETESE